MIAWPWFKRDVLDVTAEVSSFFLKKQLPSLRHHLPRDNECVCPEINLLGEMPDLGKGNPQVNTVHVNRNA